MATYYISPTGSGRGDGSSWANAARITQLNTLVDKAGPGGTVLLRADQGSYTVTAPIQLRSGGDAGAPVTIKGVDGSGAPMAAEFVSNRNVEAGVTGGEIFRLMNGADHLVFDTMTFRNVGNGAFRFGADVQDITIQHMDAYNVQRFIENNVSGTNTSASVTGLVVRDVEVHGFSKGVVHLQYNSSNILIEDVYGDSEKQSHDNFAMGVHLDGTVHDVVILRTAMGNAYNNMSGYWNGDGFTTERGVYNVRFEGTRAFGNTDAGYDLKSRNTVLVDADADHNMRNYRFWSDSITLQNSTGDDPDKTGGSGSEAQVWLADGARVTIIDSQFTNTDNGATVFALSTGALLTLNGAITYDGAGAVYSSLQSGASIVTRGTVTSGLQGGAGDDTLSGDNAVNVISGLGGADTILGLGGNDTLIGGEGKDLIYGGDGADTILGGGGIDWMDGGAGSDTFVFKGIDDLQGGVELVNAFVSGSDKLDLRGIDADGVSSNGDTAFSVVSSFTGQAGQMVIDRSGGQNDAFVKFDINGDGVYDALLHVVGPALTAADFWL